MIVLIVRTIAWLLTILEYAILISAIISWLPIPRDNKVVNQIMGLLYQITDPILAPIRGIMERYLSGRNMMMDFSPIIAILLIEVVKKIIVGIF